MNDGVREKKNQEITLKVHRIKWKWWKATKHWQTLKAIQKEEFIVLRVSIKLIRERQKNDLMMQLKNLENQHKSICNPVDGKN